MYTKLLYSVEHTICASKSVWLEGCWSWQWLIIPGDKRVRAVVWGRAAPAGRPANNLLPLGSRGGQQWEGAKEVKLSHFGGGRESARKQVYIWRNEGRSNGVGLRLGEGLSKITATFPT